MTDVAVGGTLNHAFRSQIGAKGNTGSFYSTNSNRTRAAIAGQNSTGGFSFSKQADKPNEQPQKQFSFTNLLRRNN